MPDHEGDGIGLAVVTGKLIEQMIGEKGTIVPLDRLRLDRFENVTSNM